MATFNNLSLPLVGHIHSFCSISSNYQLSLTCKTNHDASRLRKSALSVANWQIKQIAEACDKSKPDLFYIPILDIAQCSVLERYFRHPEIAAHRIAVATLFKDYNVEEMLEMFKLFDINIFSQKMNRRMMFDDLQISNNVPEAQKGVVEFAKRILQKTDMTKEQYNYIVGQDYVTFFWEPLNYLVVVDRCDKDTGKMTIVRVLNIDAKALRGVIPPRKNKDMSGFQTPLILIGFQQRYIYFDLDKEPTIIPWEEGLSIDYETVYKHGKDHTYICEKEKTLKLNFETPLKAAVFTNPIDTLFQMSIHGCVMWSKNNGRARLADDLNDTAPFELRRVVPYHGMTHSVQSMVGLHSLHRYQLFSLYTADYIQMNKPEDVTVKGIRVTNNACYVKFESKNPRENDFVLKYKFLPGFEPPALPSWEQLVTRKRERKIAAGAAAPMH